MPGFELNRFVDLTESEKTELICSICQDIFKNPVVANCCLQTYCEECINLWLASNNTCPYDRKSLDSSQLSRPPRFVFNMLGKLKVYCDNKEKGCERIIQLDQLDYHLKSCLFNKNICEECGLEIVVDHNCLKSLIEENKKLMVRVDSLETENEKYIKTIQDLSNTNPTVKLLNFKISENQMLINARKCMNSMILNSNNTSTELTDNIVVIVREAIVKERKLFEVCEYIRTNVESKFGGLWQCNAFYDDIGEYSCTVDYKYFVNFMFGKLWIGVHKVHDEVDLKKLAQLLTSGELIEKLLILKTDMNEDFIRLIEQTVFNSIKKCNNLSEFTSDLFQELPKIFGGIWHCFVFKKCLGSFRVKSKARRYIKCSVHDLNLVIFQTPNLH